MVKMPHAARFGRRPASFESEKPMKPWGETLTLEDGTEADVTPLREDHGALASIAVGVAAALIIIVSSCL